MLHAVIHFLLELPDFNGCQEVHHHSVAQFYRKQLENLQLSACAHIPACCLSHRLPECILLGSPLAAVADEVLLHLGRSCASTAAQPAFVVHPMAQQIYTACSRCIPGL